MADAERVVQDYLGHHRYDPPERDGWYSSYEIYRGIFHELGERVRAYKLYPALDSLIEAEPPVIEDSWMLTDGEDLPRIDERYQHPNQPKGARRYYRVLQTSVEYIPPHE